MLSPGFTILQTDGVTNNQLTHNREIERFRSKTHIPPNVTPYLFFSRENAEDDFISVRFGILSLNGKKPIFASLRSADVSDRRWKLIGSEAFCDGWK